MDDNYRDFIKDGPITYVGKVDSVKVYPGRNRAKLSWKLSPDPEAAYLWLRWTQAGKTDSIKLNIIRKQGIDTAETLISSLAEGAYTFHIQTFDEQGNQSVNVESFGTIYGDSFQSQLTERVISGQTKTADTLAIRFFAESSDYLVKTIFSYESTENDIKEVILPRNGQEVKLGKFKYGTDLRFRSAFLPDTLAIDTLYTSFTTLRIEN